MDITIFFLLAGVAGAAVLAKTRWGKAFMRE